MKRYYLVFAVILILFVSFASTGVLNQSSLASSGTGLSSHSSTEEESLNRLQGIFLLLSKPDPIAAIAGASPVSGTAPLTIQFSTDSSGPVETWKWDFDGDLSWDWVGTSKENQTYTYNSTGSHTATLQVSDKYGNTDTDQVVTEVGTSKVPEVSFTSDTNQLFKGQAALLSWTVTGANTIAINEGIGNVGDVGSLSVAPGGTTSYTLTATGPIGTTTSSIEIRVADPDADDLEAYITSPSDGEIVSTDSLTVSGIVSQDTAQVWVNGENAALTGLYFSKDVSLTPGMNHIAVSASWNEKTAIDSTRVTRSFTYTPQPDNSFGEQFEKYIPPDAAVASYATGRFSLVTGTIEDELASPIENVAVTILDHPEYGTAHTDITGMYSLPVEGGTSLIVVYQHNSYITAHRNIEIPVNDIVVVKRVALVSQDTELSTVNFDGNPATIVTHQSSLTSDSSGDRIITTVFQGDNKAWEVDEYGQRVRELGTIVTRSTEFSTPASMPSTLPPHSAFTYCAELSVDGVERIEFEQPVVTWVNNFLGFEVGVVVPVGFYNRDSGAWVPSKNGVVVRLLDTDSDGIADGLDSTGDGVADDLNGNSSTGDEVIGLTDATAYPPGDTFWRVEVSHFTPWDLNWGTFPPADFITPNTVNPPYVDQPGDRPEEREKYKKKIACSIEPINRILQEDIPIQGTGMKLHYASNRVPGYTYPINVPASGSTVPSSLKNIKVELRIAGQVMEQTLSASPNQVTNFEWNGEYSDGTLATDSVTAHISVGFVYDAVYAKPDDSLLEAFSQPGIEPTEVPAREEFVVWKHWGMDITTPQKGVSSKVFGTGWTLTSQHQMQVTAAKPTLHKGDGTILTDISNAVIDTFAGGGNINLEYSAPPPGTLATEVSFGAIKGIVRDSKGNTYLASWTNNSAIYKVAPDGVISIFAGQGTNIYNVNGIPATEQRIGEPIALAIDTEDNVYFFDSHWSSNSIRKIDNNGIITHVMGNADGADCLNNCTKEDDTLSDVRGITIDEEGNIYITNNVGTIGEPYNTIGKIDTNGIYNAIAGVCSGGGCLSGEDADGEKAKDVALDPAGGIAIAPDGSIYFTSLDDVVRKIDSSGILSTIAGDWSPPIYQITKDNIVNYAKVPAFGTILNRPTGITIDSAGNIFFTESGHIQKIDTNGNMSRVAGHEWNTGFSGDGGPALLALIDPVSGYSTRSALTISNNTLYFTDDDRFRKVGVFPPVIKDSDNNTVFVDKNGQGHIVNLVGRHEKTIDLQTGLALRTLSYDGEKLTSISDQFGNETTLQYDPDGKLVSITSPYGLVTTLTFDAVNNLSRVSYPDTTYFDFAYSQDGLLHTKTEPNGNTYTHGYDAHGRLSSVADEEGGVWTLAKTRTADGVITSTMTSSLGNQSVYAEDISSPGESLMDITPVSGGTSSVSWLDNGLMNYNELATGMDHSVSYNIDSLFQNNTVTKISSWTPAGLSMTVTGTNTYEDTDDDDIVDLFTGTISVNGKTTTLQQNTLTSQKNSSSPMGRATTQTYDPVTLLTSRYQVPGIADVLYQYNSRGRLTTVNQGDRTVSYTYNSDGLLSSITAPEGEIVNMSYNAAGRLINLQRPDSSSTEMSYDANGSITGIKTPAGIDHTFSYTKTGKISKYTLPGSGGSGYIYDFDSERKITSVTFPSGAQINNTYSNSRLSSSQVGTDIIGIYYLDGNRIDALTRGSESISYTYDGQLLLSTASSGTIAQTVALDYNDDFLPVTVDYADDTQTLSYDDDGLLISSNDMDITRDSQNGLPTQLDDGVFTLDITRNTFGEVTGKSSSVDNIDVFSWTAIRNRNGKILQKTEVLGGESQISKYSYDSLGRLITVRDGDDTITESYGYDANGNRTLDLGGQTYTYDNQDRLTAIAGKTYNFNDDGFLTSKVSGSETTTFNYTIRDELQGVTLADGTAITYTYDPKGRRIAKSVDGALTEKYLWSGRTRLLAIYDDNDDVLIRYDYSNSRLPESMTKEGSRYYLHFDQVGSLKAVSDTTGTIVKKIEYDSFGVIKSDTNPSFRVGLGFAGGLFDTHSQLLYFAFRDYNPETGRWNAKDPLLFRGGDSNLYAYVANDPVNSIDPYGLSESEPSYGDDYGYFDAFRDTALESFAILGDGLLIAGGATLAFGSAGVVAPVVGALFLTKGLVDLTLKEMNIIDKWFGDEPSTSGDGLRELAKHVDPDSTFLDDLATIASNTMNIFAPTAGVVGLVDKAGDIGGQVGLFDTLSDRFSRWWHGE